MNMLKAAKAYSNNESETAVSSFDSAQLIVLVYERVIDHLKIGMNSLRDGGHAVESFTKAHDLIHYGLLACLNYDSGGEIAERLGVIYDWSLREIISGRASRSPEKIENVIGVLSQLQDGWILLSETDSKKDIQMTALNE
jgi:flagellar protein FliS